MIARQFSFAALFLLSLAGADSHLVGLQESLLDLKFAESQDWEKLYLIPAGNPRIKLISDSSGESSSPELKSVDRSKTSGLFLDGRSWLKLRDDGSLKFRNDDRIVFSAWIAPFQLDNGQQVYLLGKGRTQNQGFPSNNQNYAFRIRGINNKAKVSFLFRSRSAGQPSKTDKPTEQYNRWNSTLGFPIDGQWHHLLVDYKFGHPEKIAAYIDGKKSKGGWDMGGPTTDPPVVDDDELWIGSSMGGNPTSSFLGWIRDVKLVRNPTSVAGLLKDADRKPVPFDNRLAYDKELKSGRVLVEIVEEIPYRTPPFHQAFRSAERFEVDHFAIDGLPKKYTRPGVIAARNATFLVRAQLEKAFPDGDYEFLIRSKNAATLMIDGSVVAALPMMSRNASGHEKVPKLPEPDDPTEYFPPAGHQQKTVTVTLKQGTHRIRLESLVGGPGLRNELGELILAVRRPGKKRFQLLTNDPAKPVLLTNQDWRSYSADYRQKLKQMNARQRLRLAKMDAQFWAERHLEAGRVASRELKEFEGQTIDSLLEEAWKESQLAPAGICSDETFVRRAYLDTLGIPPSAIEVEAFIASENPDKRSQLVDRLVGKSGFADHWVSYWQDVLAENPGILKPKLNNTGPFRFWIYESLLDNKPMDRFVNELIGMKGSRYDGGPAGFGQATQNDVPTAAKANVIARAFLGIDLTCARCHDSPGSHFRQQDLFEMAAMLNRAPIKVPSTSSVPNAERFDEVEVSLTPGDVVRPAWPFEKEIPFQIDATSDDSRQRLAEMITSPENLRFAEVIANRVWTRLMGRGILRSSDDFLFGRPSHPQLLRFLAARFLESGYDLRELTKLIMTSKAYQLKCTEDDTLVASFAGRKVRTLTAEQIVDSLFAVSGKSMSIGPLTFDPEGRRASNTFLNLGRPSRAWQLTGLANERDRPALALPRAQAIVDVLSAFGWRESRPNPLTQREQSTTLIQPLVLANGDASHRALQLSDDSAFTKLAIDAADPDEFADKLFLQILNRHPSEAELETVVPILAEGFADRLVAGALPTADYESQFRSGVSWSNHLHPDATRIKLRIEQAVRRGDFPTNRLRPTWRKRAEDVVWALVNSPEFILLQ